MRGEGALKPRSRSESEWVNQVGHLCLAWASPARVEEGACPLDCLRLVCLLQPESL